MQLLNICSSLFLVLHNIYAQTYTIFTYLPILELYDY